MSIANSNETQVLEIKTAQGLKYISKNRLIYVKAENRGTMLLLNNSDRVFTKHLIKWYERFLSNREFFRCHNSYIVNWTDFDCLCSCEIILRETNPDTIIENRKKIFQR